MIVLAVLNLDSQFVAGYSSLYNQISPQIHQHIVFGSPSLATRIKTGVQFKPRHGPKSSLQFLKIYRTYNKGTLIKKVHSIEKEDAIDTSRFPRRLTVLLSFPLLASTVLYPENALAVKQLQLPGRVPGLSPPDKNGMRTYRRPDAKSGGHGVGWSPIIPYTFTVPEGWDEDIPFCKWLNYDAFQVPVSIADLGGTEIDLRFASPQEGRLSVVVAPVGRFEGLYQVVSEPFPGPLLQDNDENAQIEDIGPPEKVIYAFGPELVGDNIEGKVKSAEVKEYSSRKYYQYELEAPHALITATAAGNRLYLMTVSASGLQWKKHFPSLKQIADSFRVD